MRDGPLRRGSIQTGLSYLLQRVLYTYWGLGTKLGLFRCKLRHTRRCYIHSRSETVGLNDLQNCPMSNWSKLFPYIQCFKFQVDCVQSDSGYRVHNLAHSVLPEPPEMSDRNNAKSNWWPTMSYFSPTKHYSRQIVLHVLHKVLQARKSYKRLTLFC